MTLFGEMAAGASAAAASYNTDELTTAPLHVIADAIEADWGEKVNYAARPYLDAMHDLSSIEDRYYYDDGRSIVAYFLSNATTWRGDTARAVKAELKRRLR